MARRVGGGLVVMFGELGGNTMVCVPYQLVSGAMDGMCKGRDGRRGRTEHLYGGVAVGQELESGSDIRTRRG
jgi:hypothetical protein